MTDPQTRPRSTRSSPPLQDFNPDDIAKTSDVNELTERVRKLEEAAHSADTMGDRFSKSFDRSSLLRTAVSKAVLSTLNDVDNREALSAIVVKVNRDSVWSLIQKIGFAVWTLLVALISGGVVAILLQSFKK